MLVSHELVQIKVQLEEKHNIVRKRTSSYHAPIWTFVFPWVPIPRPQSTTNTTRM